MNYYGILTNYEERMEANLEQYSRPEKAGAFHLRLDYRTWGKRMCLFCYFTDEDTGEKIRLACWRNAKEHYAPLYYPRLRSGPHQGPLALRDCKM